MIQNAFSGWKYGPSDRIPVRSIAGWHLTWDVSDPEIFDKSFGLSRAL